MGEHKVTKAQAIAIQRLRDAVTACRRCHLVLVANSEAMSVHVWRQADAAASDDLRDAAVALAWIAVDEGCGGGAILSLNSKSSN